MSPCHCQCHYHCRPDRSTLQPPHRALTTVYLPPADPIRYLQRRLNIWQQRVLVRWSELDDTEQREIDCANYHRDRCPPGVMGGPKLEARLVRKFARKWPSKPRRDN